MKTSQILSAIHSDFAATYKSASKFIDSGSLWDFCIKTISDPVCMEKIVFANDLDVPPIKSLLLLYERTMNPAPDFKFSPTESQCMGALMGFIFKFVLGYTDQKERCTINKFEVKTATRFLNGPVVSFESED